MVKLFPAVWLLLSAVGLLGGCERTPRPNPHYVLGEAYEAGGVWWYPRESQDLDETGLAAVYPDKHAGLTTDGEAFTQHALAAAHPTIQLPAIARLTNLQTGRSLLVRINDRGTPTPHRLVQVTQRVAMLLGMQPDGVAQVRLTLLGGPSEAAEQQAGGGPHLPIAAAPRRAVASASLAPPLGVREESGHRLPPAARAAAPVAAEDVPVQLPERVTQVAPAPGRLWVRLGRFQSYQYAAIEQARLARLGAHIEKRSPAEAQAFQVVIGPLGGVAAADAVLDQAIRAGAADARIVVK